MKKNKQYKPLICRALNRMIKQSKKSVRIIARDNGVAINSVKNWMTGETAINFENFIMLSEYFGYADFLNELEKLSEDGEDTLA